jgi:glycosyltransferase involved in cell wall biosynthesis
VVGACAIVPAFNASSTLAPVVISLRRVLGVPVIVVDDGSRDATSEVARECGAISVCHPQNRGKGAALKTGLREAAARGMTVVVAVDADGQHPAESALSVLEGSDDPRALVLGVRDLVRDGAPASNQFGNRVSNFFLSTFSGRRLRDTQCGLRRYPVVETLALGARADGFGFEAEVVLRAIAARLPVVEVPIAAVYPPPGGQTHRRSVADPARIVAIVALTAAELHLGRKPTPGVH